EHADGLALAHGRVLREVEREARLADARAGGEDDQIALLESARHGIEIRESRADAADLAFVLMQVVESVVCRVEQRLERCETRLDALLTYGEELLLRTIDRLADIGGVVVA